MWYCRNMFIDCHGLSMLDFFTLCREQRFRTKFIRVLKQIEYPEYYLKFADTSFRTAHRTNFKLEVIRAKDLTRRTPNDTDTFNFSQCSSTQKAIGFLSKTGRSYLVVPCPDKKKREQYDSGHIAQFMRKAKSEYIHAFWNTIGDTFFDYFKSHPSKSFRLNTHGHDVYWLHARFTFQ